MTKVIAMYLPQYHETEENNKWWGKGFTDWTSVKTAAPLFDGHRQPRIPQDDNYYDLSDVDVIRWQADLAQKYGIDGFCIYHYWFSSKQRLLTKPAELLLDNRDINMPFFFAWDNCSWVRTWSRYKHNVNAWSPKLDQDADTWNDNKGILAKLDYGTEEDWKIHYEYLNHFFMDDRYIKINNKPVFILFNYHEKETMTEMMRAWDAYAKGAGWDGIYFMSRLNPFDHMEGFDALFTYEPMFSAWQNRNLVNRIVNKIVERLPFQQRKLTFYDYDKVWGKILRHASKQSRSDVMYGGFVGYDDTPRRGITGKVIVGARPEKFGNYFWELYNQSLRQGKEFVFLTAWNEWGEGAYLEPDNEFGEQYLCCVRDRNNIA